MSRIGIFDYAIGQGEAEGRKEGLAKGRSEGLAQGHALLVETIKNTLAFLKQIGVSQEDIAEYKALHPDIELWEDNDDNERFI